MWWAEERVGGEDVEIARVGTSFEKRVVEEETGHLLEGEAEGLVS